MTADTALIASNRQDGRGQVHPPAAIVARSGDDPSAGASWIEEQQAYNFSLYPGTPRAWCSSSSARTTSPGPSSNSASIRGGTRPGTSGIAGWARTSGEARYYAYRIDGPAPPGRAAACLRPGQGPARPLGEGGLLPAGVRPRGRQAAGPQPRDGAAGRPAAPGPASTGVPTGRRHFNRTPRSSTRCTSAASRGAQRAASRPSAGAPSPAWSRRFPT